MAISQGRPKQRANGGKYKAYRKKKQHELGRLPVQTRIAESKMREVRTLGGNVKQKMLNCDILNLYDPKTKKCSKAKIISVQENSADRHFVRRNIMTLGAIVVTDKGRAKITNRPGQEGAINAIAIE